MGVLTAITGPFSPGMDQLVQLVNQLNAILAATTTNAGALAVTGNFAVGSNVFTVASASGNTAVGGTLGVTGNTTLSGTLGVTGAVTLSSTLTGGSSSNIAINTNKFTVTASSGNTAIAGTLALTGLATLSAGANSADNLTMTAAAKGLVLKQGSNGKCGTFVCNGATPVTVSNTSIAITDTIVISLNTVGGTVGAVPAVKTITASTGFTVAGTASDTSTYNYAIISNAA